MTDPEIEERLGRLAKATENVRPRADFTAKVMGAVNAEKTKPAPSDWWSDVPFVARRLLPVAAIAAAVGIAWAVRTSGDVDTAFANSYDSMELEW